MARKQLVAIVTIAGVPLAYIAAALAGGLIPRNADWMAPERGVRIYVEDNGIHTSLVLPVIAEGVDWRGVAPASALRDPRYGGYGWRSFGWGNRDFYVNTPQWRDLNPLTVVTSAIGVGATVVHVDFIPEPRTGPAVRSIVLRPEEYRRLAAFVRATFAGEGATVPGYAAYDAFYPATGRYSAFRTCNVWTGEALAAGGVRVGAWTPLPQSVMAWLPTG